MTLPELLGVCIHFTARKNREVQTSKPGRESVTAQTAVRVHVCVCVCVCVFVLGVHALCVGLIVFLSRLLYI